MKILIIGAGGIGGLLAAKLAKAHKDVALIDQGKHLEAIQNDGLTLISPSETRTYKLSAYDSDSYVDKPDVIFISTKAYSLDPVITFLKKDAFKDALIIPLLNPIGAAEEISQALGEDFEVLDGVAYALSSKLRPGVILQDTDNFRIVAGFMREAGVPYEKLIALNDELRDTDINFEITKDAKAAHFKKFTVVSPFAAVTSYLSVDAAPMQVPGEQRELYKALTNEVIEIGRALGFPLQDASVQRNLERLDMYAPTSNASMARDILAKRDSELDGLIFSVVRLGRKLGVATPNYEKVAKRFGFEA
ncbi:MAG: 2-dehydropantoate 2-reductase [Coriobacteriia bacterium]|nr:2-dehydropantoate 2-reductase [Coriobacteriia bacterium]